MTEASAPRPGTMRHDADPETVLTVADGIATIRFNRPGRRNSFTEAFMESLLESVSTAVTSSDARVIVVTGGEQCFSVGGDLDEFGRGLFAPEHMTPEESAEVLRRHARAAQLLHESEKVSIAAVAGPCAGAGFSLAAACDLRIASTDAVFRTAFLDAALASDYGGIWSTARLLGESRAKTLFLLNQKLTAAQALEMGFVSSLVESGELEQQAARMAEGLAAKAPLALATVKRLFRSPVEGFGAALDEESLAQKQCAYTADAREAASAFVERRAPRFSGS